VGSAVLPDFVPDVSMPTSMPTGWLVLALVGLCTLEATLLLGSVVPGEMSVVLAAGLVDARHVPLTMLAAATGAMAGQGGGYLLGRLAGPGVRTSRVGRRIPERFWARGEYVARTARVSTMIAVRFVAVGHTLAPVAAGSLGMPVRRFIGLAVVSSLVWAGVWSAVGLIAASAGRKVNSELVAMVLVGLGMLVASFTLNRRLREAPDTDYADGTTADGATVDSAAVDSAAAGGATEGGATGAAADGTTADGAAAGSAAAGGTTAGGVTEGGATDAMAGGTTTAGTKVGGAAVGGAAAGGAVTGGAVMGGVTEGGATGATAGGTTAGGGGAWSDGGRRKGAWRANDRHNGR
jgi:membrane-associated protein